MDKEKIKYYLVDNIMDYLKFQLLNEIENNNDDLPVFNIVLSLMVNMNEYEYSYSLVDLDELLFNKLMAEVISLFT